MKNNFFTLDPLFLFKLISLPFIIFLFYKTNKIYIGENFYYIFFSITSISYLFLALSYKISFFHIFMSLFLFLGFWFKFSLNTIINYSNQNNYYAEGTGNFDFQSNSLDEVIMISTLSILSFMFGMIVIYFPRIKNNLKKNFLFSKNFITKIIFFTLATLICFLNFKFEIYVKGLISAQSSNFVIYNFFAWFYQVGSLMAISYLLDLELKKEKFASLMFLIIVYLFIFSLSLNSRNYIFFLLPFFISVYFYSKQNNMKFESKFIFYLLSLISILLFLLSIGFSNKYRMNNYSFPIIEYNNKVEEKKNSSEININNEEKDIILRPDLSLLQMIKNRFVGIDSLMTVYSKEDKSFRLYFDSFNEKFSPGKMSFYESEFNINTYSYVLKEYKRNHFITVPGIIAHLYYSGSIPFLIFFCFLLSLIFTYLEIFIVKNHNLTCLACITSFIFSYRLAHFGYAPQQSYKLILGVIIFFVILIILNYFLNGAKKSKIFRQN